MNLPDSSAVHDLNDGYELLCVYAGLIAMLPIDDWLEQLEHAEAVGPILDPTLMRSYASSEKPHILKGIMRAALDLKREVEAAQPYIEREMRKE